MAKRKAKPPSSGPGAPARGHFAASAHAGTSDARVGSEFAKPHERALAVAAGIRAGTIGLDDAAREAWAAGCSAQAVNAIRLGDYDAAKIVDEDAESLRKQVGGGNTESDSPVAEE